MELRKYTQDELNQIELMTDEAILEATKIVSKCKKFSPVFILREVGGGFTNTR